MAANKQQLGEEATCSICLEYFTDPVAAECGHAFCLSCITRYWEGFETDFPCPKCRDTSKNKILRPNRQLGNIVELLKQLHTPSAAPQGEDLCREHEEKLKLFCEDDQVPICLVCRESRVHKAHSVLPMQEAAQEHKGNFKNQVEALHSTFDLLKKFLDKEKQLVFCKLESEHKDNMKKIQEKMSELEKQQSTHQDLITEIEGKCQQQDVDLLKDVQIILRRCNDAKTQKPPDDVVVEQTLKSNGQHASLQDKLLELRETFPAKLEWTYIKSWATAVTLDPDSAHQSLVLSEDGRIVRIRDREQFLPDTPQRFTGFTDVLGTQRMTSGRHYWEVEVEVKVGDKMNMTLGVCDEAVSRKGELTPSPENGYWTVCLRDGEYEANTYPLTLPTRLVRPRVVGLFLDYEAGRLSVYNVDDRSLLFTFSGASFPPTLRPFFSPEGGKGRKNEGWLRILPVTQE